MSWVSASKIALSTLVVMPRGNWSCTALEWQDLAKCWKLRVLSLLEAGECYTVFVKCWRSRTALGILFWNLISKRTRNRGYRIHLNIYIFISIGGSYFSISAFISNLKNLCSVFGQKPYSFVSSKQLPYYQLNLCAQFFLYLCHRFSIINTTWEWTKGHLGLPFLKMGNICGMVLYSNFQAKEY